MGLTWCVGGRHCYNSCLAHDSQYPDPHLSSTPSSPGCHSHLPSRLSSCQHKNQQNGCGTARIIMSHSTFPIPTGPAPCPPSTPPPMASHLIHSSPGTNSYFPPPSWPKSNPPPQEVFTPHFICLLHAPPAGTGCSSSISRFFPLPPLDWAACFF